MRVTRDEPPQAAAPSRQPRKSSFLKEAVIILVSALVLSWVIKSFFVQAFFIPSASMEDTLVEGDRVLVSKMVPGLFDVHRGDVVVFKDPGTWLRGTQQPERTALQQGVSDVMTFVGLLPQDSGEHLIKRVVAVGGDEVACCDAEGRVTVNGQSVDEPYLKPGVEPSVLEFEQIVPDGSLWVMGDNRSNSTDSRYNAASPGGGFVPLDNVVGTAFVKVWPLDRAGWLRNPGETFEDVPAP
ncbi:signal peptidase I [Sanguibacter suaedae]|uniref:Signal peptidase I n=1 Tax=Sanguibacter suaedae TaxID=2795737 RepID=A0A934I7C6_9MICO|nr:signal peptidase I [Sanguibacter suaedae]MBI9115561.1 signal peptidase I [Sanguibacter suaedae]